MSTEERTFNPTLSTNEVFREDDMTRCLSDDLNAIESDISALETGKAAVNHTHSEYAAADHIHSTINVSTANEDLNDYTIAGVYSFAVAQQPTNRPAGNSNGWLVVIPWNSNPTTTTIKQFWLRHGTVGTNDHSVYVRTKVGDYGWSSWSRMVTDKEYTLTTMDGDVSFSWTGQDIVAKFKALESGMYTVYSRGGSSSGTSNAPNVNEGWRYICHKTGSANYGWILAFGTSGSVYAGYLDNGTWRGWRCIHSVSSNVLWSGKLYPNANHTITPSKKLSECRTGWMLLWSDYDPDASTANDADFVTTMIPKYRYDGEVWNGKNFLCDIPRFYGSNADDTSTEKRIMKTLTIYDDKIVGNVTNSKGDRTDVVLRAVYEF